MISCNFRLSLVCCAVIVINLEQSSILDKPKSPRGPLEVSDISPDGCTLSWRPPEDDGGAPIQNYVVEKKGKDGKWKPVSKFCRGNKCEVTDLEEGEKYEFRVKAVNEQGESEPLETDRPITAKHPFGELMIRRLH